MEKTVYNGNVGTVKRGNRYLLLLGVLWALTTLDLPAQWGRGGPGNRFYRPYSYYQPSTRAYYGALNPFYRLPTRPYYYYPPKYYPQAALPYRGYGYGYGGVLGYGSRYRTGASSAPYYGSWYPRLATYYLSSPSAAYYAPARTATESEPVVRANFSHLIFNVTPGSALIYIDDRLVGSARSFGTQRERYEVLEGEYVLRIENPGYQKVETLLQIIPDRTIHLDIELQRLPR